MKLKTQTPTVYPIIVPTSSSLKSFNFYLVKTKQALILVDTGVNVDKCWNYLMNVLEDNGFSLDDIDKIILTHNHNDHIGLVNRIRSHNPIPVYAHRDAMLRLKRDEAFLKKRIAFFQTLYNEMGCGDRGEKQIEKLNKALKKNKSQIIEGEILPLVEGDEIDGFRVIETPGHAPDHIVLLHEDSGLLLAGDHLIQHVSSNALIEPDKQGEKISSLLQYEHSLKKLKDYSLSIAYPGHGEIVKNPLQLIDKRIEGIEKKSEKLNNIVTDQSLTAAEIAKIYYQEKYGSKFSLVMSEIIGHLDQIESYNQVTKEKQDEIFYYYTRKTN